MKKKASSRFSVSKCVSSKNSNPLVSIGFIKILFSKRWVCLLNVTKAFTFILLVNEPNWVYIFPILSNAANSYLENTPLCFNNLTTSAYCIIIACLPFRIARAACLKTSIATSLSLLRASSIISDSIFKYIIRKETVRPIY